jgi:hypothetical protein
MVSVEVLLLLSEREKELKRVLSSSWYSWLGNGFLNINRNGIGRLPFRSFLALNK